MAIDHNAWDNMEANTFQKMALGVSSPHIKSFLEQVPYRKDDPAGNKLEQALSDNKDDFRSRLNDALSDPKIQQGIADLPPEIMAAHIDSLIAEPENIREILTVAQADATAAPAHSAPAAVAAVTTPEPDPAPNTTATTAFTAAAQNAPPQNALPTLEQQQDALMESIAKAPGFETFLEKVAENPDLQQSMEIAFEGTGSNLENSVAILENIQQRIEKDPQMFHRLNQILDENPNAVSTFAREMVANPDKAFASLDQKMALDNMMATLENSMQPLMAKLGDGPMGQLLQSLMDYLPDVMGMVASLSGIATEMKTALGDLTGNSQTIVTNHPQGQTPMTDQINLVNGGQNPAQSVTLADGSQPPAPGNTDPEPQQIASLAPATPGG